MVNGYQKPIRFEITIQCGLQQIKHVCAAPTEAEAVDRIMCSYAKSDPRLTRVVHLGVLPKSRK